MLVLSLSKYIGQEFPLPVLSLPKCFIIIRIQHHRIINAESGILPRQKILRHAFIYQFFFNKVLNYFPPEELGHMFDILYWDMKKIALLIKTTFHYLC